jgi:hypothetical protein
MISLDHRGALLADYKEREFSAEEKMRGQNFNPLIRSGNRQTGYDSRAPEPIWPHEIAAAKKKKAKRKTEKKMRKQSRAKKK